MGGDNAPKAPVAGAVRAARELNCEIMLIGLENAVMPILKELGADNDKRITFVPAEEVISMDDTASTAVMSKKKSSMTIGLNMLKSGEADALVSAGSTGALLSGATLIAKRIKGIKRAALATGIPCAGGKVLLLDSGANPECTPEMLLQFALMGSVYAGSVWKIGKPRVALLNNGTEESKGTAVHKEAHSLFSEASAKGIINFIGNIEGREIFSGSADVIVCDGFSGNVALKTIEGTAGFLTSMIKKLFMKNLITKISALGVKKGFKEIKAYMDYSEVGGAPFLGVAAPVIKAHGSSDEKAIRNAISQAAECVSGGVTESIVGGIAAIQSMGE